MENEKKKYTQEEIAERIAKSKALAAKRFERVEIPEGVKVSYYENPDSMVDQRICVAQKYDSETGVVTFGFSLNKPPKITWDESKQAFKLHSGTGDVFSRRAGRNVALRSMVHKTKVLKDEFPNAACLRQIVTICAEQPNLRRNLRKLRTIAGDWYEILCGEQKRQEDLRTLTKMEVPGPTKTKAESSSFVSTIAEATTSQAVGFGIAFGIAFGVVSGIVGTMLGY